MRIRKLLLGMAAAMVLVGAMAGSASAGRLSFSSQTFRVAWARVTYEGAFGRIVCPITLEGSLHSRNVLKVAGALIGYITAASLGACATGAATILTATLPWHVRYASFGGTLPSIVSVRLHVVDLSMQVREPAFTCLLRTTAAGPAFITLTREIAGGFLTEAIVGGEAVPTSCGVNGRFSSNAAVPTVLGAATRITVTLI